MRILCSIAGGLFAIAAGVVSAGAMPSAPGAPMASKAKAETLTGDVARNSDPGIRCIRAPCYVPRPPRPWYARGRVRQYPAALRVVCYIGAGYYGPHKICYTTFF
jgi:hypothetical protein